MQVFTGQSCRSWAQGSAQLTPESTGRMWNLGRKSYCHCRQPQALSIFLYLTNCSSEPELFRADSSDSSLEQGGHRHRWWLQFSPAQAYPDPQGGLAGQLVQFVKQAGGSEVEHSVLGTQRGGTSPSPRGVLRAEDAEMSCSQPALAGNRAQDGLGYLWCHPLAWLK